MALFVENLSGGNNANRMPIEDSRLNWSESVASGATSTNAVRVSSFVSVTSDEDGYCMMGPTPVATANPRHRVKAGVVRSFAVYTGDYIAYVAG